VDVEGKLLAERPGEVFHVLKHTTYGSSKGSWGRGETQGAYQVP
jgi:hypothetical protein